MEGSLLDGSCVHALHAAHELVADFGKAGLARGIPGGDFALNVDDLVHRGDGLVRDLGQQTIPGQPAPSFPPARKWSTVEFSDLRFAYDFLDTSMAGASNQRLGPTLTQSRLSGWVYILDGHEEAGQFLDGKEQR